MVKKGDRIILNGKQAEIVGISKLMDGRYLLNVRFSKNKYQAFIEGDEEFEVMK